jgi:hypothetical protein
MKCSGVEHFRRQYRIFDLPILDLAFSALAGFWVGKNTMKLETATQWTLWSVFWLFLGIFVHYIFNVKTNLGYKLGINDRPTEDPCSD